MILRRAVVFLSILAWATPSAACDDSPDLPILPGETKPDFDERFQQTWNNLRVVHRLQWQEKALGQASLVFLGKVIGQRDLPGRDMLHEVTVEPVYVIKGTRPNTPQVLVDVSATSCGPRGDGRATYARKGEWVFVFEGLPKSDWRPRGYDSISAGDAVADYLISALWKVGSDPYE